MPNLYPDMSRDQYEGSKNFIYAAPLLKAEWDAIKKRATMQTQSGVQFYLVPAHGTDGIHPTILLRKSHHTDEQMIEAAAWLRMTLSHSGLIYAVPYVAGMSMSQRALTTAGAPRDICLMFDLPKEEEDES